MTVQSPVRPVWQRPAARPRRLHGLVLDEEPALQLSFYGERGEVVVKTERHGDRWRSYLVGADAVAAALAGWPRTSGLLPPTTLAAGTVRGAPFLVRWEPPRPTTIAVIVGDRAGASREFSFVTPPLVLAGWRTDFRLFALDEPGWPAGDRRLSRAPFPNTYPSGEICWGTGERPPEAGPASIVTALDVFLTGSRFNWHVAHDKSRRFPANVTLLYSHLAGASAYPLDDLLPAGLRLADLVDGELWR